MKFFKKMKSHHFAALFLILFILSYVIGRFVIVQNRKDIFKSGQTSICRVYKCHIDGEVDIIDAYYFYYYKKRKYFDYYIVKDKNIHPINKFYKVFFIPGKEGMSVVDYSLEINPDSVYKFFPNRENPFENELKKILMTRKAKKTNE